MKKYALLLFFLFVVSCQDRHLIEEVGFLHVLGLDQEDNTGEESEILVTGVIPQVEPQAKEDKERLTSMSIGDNEGMLDLSRQSDREIMKGQLRSVLFGTSLAEKGVLENIRTMNRDPIFGTRVHVVVVDGSANELLSKDYPQHPQISQYISGLLEKESVLNTIPETRLHQFTRDLYDDGIDPVTPILTMEKDSIMAAGIALFKDDRYVGKIEPRDTRVFFFLSGNFNAGSLHINVTEKEKEEKVPVLFSSIRNKRGVTVTHPKDPEKMKIKIDVRVQGALLEYDGPLDITKKKELKKLEQQLAKKVEERATQVIKTLQESGVDSLGLGKVVRNKLSYKEWSQLNWKEVYPDVEVTTKVNTKVNNIGVFS